MDKLLSASEIAALRLTGLPTTKVAITAMALREGWYFEEKTGIGGTRRVFEIPSRYLDGQEASERHTAAEIANMRIPDLPTTRAQVSERAKREGWAYEERNGIGGTRRAYEIPEKYLPSSTEGKKSAPNSTSRGKVVGTIASGVRANPERLALAVRALEEWAAENRITIDPERKGAIIAVLYNHLIGGADRTELDDLLSLMR